MKHRRWIAVIITVVLLSTLLGGHAYAAPGALTDVSGDMGDPRFWTGGDPAADMVLAEAEELEALNRSILDTPECTMTDLLAAEERFDAQAFYRGLWSSVLQDAGKMMNSRYYGEENELIGGEDLVEILSNIDGREVSTDEALRYGVCVRRSDMRWLPGDAFATDEKGDLNYNSFQLYGVRVNEPLLIRGVSADGAYYYCNADCCSGWVPAEDVAICADREEWLEACFFPDDEAIVVTQGKLFLETSNVSPETSGVLLTLGTVLRRVDEKDYDLKLNQRANAHNYAVWLPLRQADGSYGRTIALIAQNYSVSEGYLPLTENNILTLAYSMLGNAYGWGGMLDSADCSSYVRDVYRCFGLALPRNTTWQAAMPALSFDVTEMGSAAKEALLSELPAGTLLYMSGHEMLYLGQAGGRGYVISAVSSIFDAEAGKVQRIRSVVINALDKTVRGNGKSWLESLTTVLVPWLEPDAMPELRAELPPEPGDELSPEEKPVVDTQPGLWDGVDPDYPFMATDDDGFAYNFPPAPADGEDFAPGFPPEMADADAFDHGFPPEMADEDELGHDFPSAAADGGDFDCMCRPKRMRDDAPGSGFRGGRTQDEDPEPVVLTGKMEECGETASDGCVTILLPTSGSSITLRICH